MKGFVVQPLGPAQRAPHEDASLSHLDTHEDKSPVEQLHIDSRPGVLEAVGYLLSRQLLRVDQLIHSETPEETTIVLRQVAVIVDTSYGSLGTKLRCEHTGE